MAKGRRGSAPAPVRHSAMALYEQVKDFIARKIQEGTWRAGDRLPSEKRTGHPVRHLAHDGEPGIA